MRGGTAVVVGDNKAEPFGSRVYSVDFRHGAALFSTASLLHFRGIGLICRQKSLNRSGDSSV
jgi:hypothetical protein